jgi:hypothetical protein
MKNCRLVAARLGLVIAVVATLAACTERSKVSIPATLQGHWVTDTPGYENRFLQLEKDFVLIGINEDDTPSIQHVSKVDVEQVGKVTAYTIYSSAPHVNYHITLFLDPANGGVLWIKNKENVVWKRRVATAGADEFPVDPAPTTTSK